MKIKHILLQYKNHLNKASITTYQLDAELILAHALKVTRLQMLMNLQEQISLQQKNYADKLILRRANLEPMAYIIGYKDFWKHSFIVNRSTLIPRPETELIIEKVLQFYQNKDLPLKILDLGTGSGCIIISILHEYPNASGIGVDISKDALSIAKKNSKLIKVNNRLKLIKSNWFDSIAGKFDIIVANPPYISEHENIENSVKNFEPATALFAPKSGLAHYYIIANHTVKFLNPHGMFFFEVGNKQSDAVSNICNTFGLEIIEIAQDLAKINRVICGNSKS